jgi:hypothetical protein
MLQAELMDRITQVSFRPCGCVRLKMPIISRTRDACELAQALHVGSVFGTRHGFDERIETGGKRFEGLTHTIGDYGDGITGDYGDAISNVWGITGTPYQMYGLRDYGDAISNV